MVILVVGLRWLRLVSLPTKPPYTATLRSMLKLFWRSSTVTLAGFTGTTGLYTPCSTQISVQLAVSKADCRSMDDAQLRPLLVLVPTGVTWQIAALATPVPKTERTKTPQINPA